MSAISFPLKDLTRRKTQTIMTFSGLALAIASTIFLVLFGGSIGLETSAIAKGGQLTSGFSNIFSQFILVVTALNLVTGPITVSFLVHIAMSQRTKDIGLMKASGCLTKTVFGYYFTELSLLVVLSSIVGIALGITAFYGTTLFLNATGFYISQIINPMAIFVVATVTIVASHIFGAKPIREASKIKPTEAMSSIHRLGTTSGTSKRTRSRLGLAFKIASRNVIRQKNASIQAIICLTIISTLTIISITGGIIANQTTINYAERAIGKNIVVIGHPAITENYVKLLSQFFEKSQTQKIYYISSEYSISDSIITKLEQTPGIQQLDPRIILEHTVREVPGIILDPVEETRGVIIGDSRSDEALIIGVDPTKVVNDWLVFGRTLEEHDKSSALIGDSLAVSMFTNARNQSIKIFENTVPYNIAGVCVDPLNNGKVVYLPFETIYENSNQSSYNLLFVQIDPLENQQIITQIKNIASTEHLNVVELDATLDKHISFLNNIWSLVMLFPLFSLATATILLISYITLSVSEQQHEFGIMRALGAKPKIILKTVFFQASIIIIVSGIAGIFFGLNVTYNFLIPNPVISQNTIIIVSTWLLTFFGILCTTSLYPARKAINTNVVDMLSGTI